MIGEVKLSLQTPRYSFELSFDRNISMIRGFSGTGKSLLCDLLQRAVEGEEGIYVSLSGADKYIVMPAITEGSTTVQNWQTIVAKASNTIIFIDEMCDCLKSGVFSKKIQGTTNYFVIISRKAHSDLPYSVNSVYYFDNGNFSRRHVVAKKLYPNSAEKIAPKLIVTEDNGAGKALYEKMYSIPVDSAKSKTKIIKKARILIAQGKTDILFIVDGAAFGDMFDSFSRYLDASNISYAIFAPESFEWLVLHSNTFVKCAGCKRVLDDYLTIIDWSKFFSAERYFTHVLKEYSKELGLIPYDKSESSLDARLLTTESLAQIKKVIPITLQKSCDKTSYFSDTK